ncbi:small acid-soluble spore protein Tlp [Pullulanibacillus sp. KACC 23026]|uniref:small acid-soluble spore protein Tlp n=1 Tax=Pullulanibacillus sp. KACC 23026 TaxID=3028315 RepID=UPI0023AF4651|nr:small acid-soluble spore protein Tlp [Pullulanibacillus sp. KACC 23026]WEG12548.1 small acid-soluble spore protein Tlp [Pullulanibacillus sp. KACC 23026]
MAYQNKPNPDDRSDNVEKLQEMVQNTVDNMEEAEKTLDAQSSARDRSGIEAKNARREEAIQFMQQEIKDEMDQQQ